MASTPFPIVLHDHTRAGIRWRVSIHPEIDRGPGISSVRFLKSGQRGKLLDQIAEWGPEGWRSEPSRKVPKPLIQRIEMELQRRHRPSRPQPQAAAGSVGLRSYRVAGVREALSGGRMSFQAFLAMELVEACLPEPYRRHMAPGH